MSKEIKTYKIVGLMSGTSMDGLDICVVEFFSENQQWNFNIVSTETKEYSAEWTQRLTNAKDLSGLDLAILDRAYGSLLGEMVKDHLSKNDIKVDYIASHGHTIFHQIDKKLSLQIGHGAFIAAASGIDTIADFRSTDTAYDGQGAPLVPTAEMHLFPKTKLFMNIGGIANISIHEKQSIIGFDICSANQVLNYLSKKYFDKDYDQNGSIAKSGKMLDHLFQKLNQLSYYDLPYPKSLGREFTEQEIFPLINNSNAKAEDLLHTYTMHIVHEICSILKDHKEKGAVMISGGGAYNHFLIQMIRAEGIELMEVPSTLIEYKEALSFAFLGLLRILKQVNVLSSISGASKNNIGGSVYLS